MKHLLLILLAFALLSAVQAQKDTNDFVTTWRTTLSTPTNPSTNDSSVHINIDTTRVYNYDVDWDNDGVFDNLGVTKAITHQYPDTGTYTIRIRGQFPRIVFGFDIWYNNVPILNSIVDHEKLLTIDQWGNTAWEDLYFAFSGCYNMTYNATDVPNLSSGPRLGGMFYFCSKFDGAIGNWDVSRVKVMDHMFEGAFEFKQNLSSWIVDSVTNMELMFAGCYEFDQNLNSWNVSQVTNMKQMFFKAYDFNQDISSWDVSSVTTMEGMFLQDSAFNQDISSWQVDSVENFREMFKDAVSFNQDISTWNVDSAILMNSMLEGATSFNQNLGNWDVVSKWKFMRNMLDNTNISVQNYDATLIAWEARVPLGVARSREIGALGLKYCLADSVRAEMYNKRFRPRGDVFDCLGVGINEELQQEQASFKVFPNPTGGKIFIETVAGEIQQQELFIYNMQGQLVFTTLGQNQKQQVDLSGYKSGIYLLRIGKESKRIVVL